MIAGRSLVIGKTTHGLSSMYNVFYRQFSEDEGGIVCEIGGADLYLYAGMKEVIEQAHPKMVLMYEHFACFAFEARFPATPKDITGSIARQMKVAENATTGPWAFTAFDGSNPIPEMVFTFELERDAAKYLLLSDIP